MNKLSDKQLSIASGGKLPEENRENFEELSLEILQDLDNLSEKQKSELVKQLEKDKKKK